MNTSSSKAKTNTSSSSLNNSITQQHLSLADQTLAGSAATELLASLQIVPGEIMSDDEYKLFLMDMKDIHNNLMKDMDPYGDEREIANEEWWNSLALNKNAGPASATSSPNQSLNNQNTTNNNTPSNNNNSNVNNSNKKVNTSNNNSNNNLKLNSKLIKLNSEGADFSESLNLNTSGGSLGSDTSRARDIDDDEEGDDEDELSSSTSSLAQLRKLVPRIPKLIPPKDDEEKSTLQMFNFTSPKKTNNRVQATSNSSSDTTDTLLKSPKQQLDSKKKDLSIFNLDNDDTDEESVFSLTNSPKKSIANSTSKRNFENTFESFTKAMSPAKQLNLGVETITIPKKEYEDLKTENVILQGRLIQMELMHEKLLSMILK